MTKDDFIKLGLDKEMAEKCAEASKTELDNFVEKSRYDTEVQAKTTLEAQVKEHNKQLEELKKSVGDTEKLNKTIADLQEANKKAKADYDKSIKDMQINHAIETGLKDAKAKNLTAAKALLNLADIDFEDGKIKGLDKQIKHLVESEDTKFLFDVAPTSDKGKPDSKLRPTNTDSKPIEISNGGLSLAAQMAKQYSQSVAPSADK